MKRHAIKAFALLLWLFRSHLSHATRGLRGDCVAQGVPLQGMTLWEDHQILLDLFDKMVRNISTESNGSKKRSSLPHQRLGTSMSHQIHVKR